MVYFSSCGPEDVTSVRVTEEAFENLVVAALDTLPEDLLELMNNVEVTFERFPTRAQMQRAGVRRGTLLGLYEGIPLTQRTSSYSLVVPDKITIFQRPIEQICSTQEEIVAQVRKTVIHEVAHHFGIGEERLQELGWG
jgi:predicted Zn-dependent protease with MMP-like domain